MPPEAVNASILIEKLTNATDEIDDENLEADTQGNLNNATSEASTPSILSPVVSASLKQSANLET